MIFSIAVIISDNRKLVKNPKFEEAINIRIWRQGYTVSGVFWRQGDTEELQRVKNGEKI